MKKRTIVAIALLVVGAVVLAIVPATRDELHWRWASLNDGTASYESYMKTWPAGRHATEAQARHDEHGWVVAEAANTVRAFERYAQLYDHGRHVAEAHGKIESLHWQEAVAANTVQGFDRYLHLHPEGKHAGEAKQRHDEIACSGLNDYSIEPSAPSRTVLFGVLLSKPLGRYSFGEGIAGVASFGNTIKLTIAYQSTFMRVNGQGGVFHYGLRADPSEVVQAQLFARCYEWRKPQLKEDLIELAFEPEPNIILLREGGNEFVPVAHYTVAKTAADRDRLVCRFSKRRDPFLTVFSEPFPPLD